jgi:hypothetical protein
MTRCLRILGLCVLVWTAAPAAATAQVIGTFRWQFQPYCNIVTVVVTQVGGIYRLEGSDNQCGAPRAASVIGTAFPNPDGTIGLGFTIIAAPSGEAVQVDAAVSLPSANGTWRDSYGATGPFTLTAGAGTGGSPRPRAMPVKVNELLTNAFSFTSTGAVPLNNAGATSVSFNLNTAGPVVLTYSAECAVAAAAGDSVTWMNLDVLHNGVVLPPTDSDDAFCTSNGTVASDGWVRASVTLVVPGVAGVNTISITAGFGFGSGTGRLDDAALVIK